MFGAGVRHKRTPKTARAKMLTRAEKKMRASFAPYLHAKIGKIKNNTQDRFILFLINSRQLNLEADVNFLTDVSAEQSRGGLKTGKQWETFLVNRNEEIRHGFLLPQQSVDAKVRMHFKPIEGAHQGDFAYESPYTFGIFNFDKNEFWNLSLTANIIPATPRALEFYADLSGNGEDINIDMEDMSHHYFFNINLTLEDSIENSIIDLDVAMGNPADFPNVKE